METPNSNESSNVEQMDVSESVNKDVSNIDNPEQTQETQSLEEKYMNAQVAKRDLPIPII